MSENSSKPFVADLKYFQFLTSYQEHWDRMQEALLTEDEIGSVLRVHLLIEKDLMTWLCCATRNNTLFQQIGKERVNVSFDGKNMLARNSGLSHECYKFISRLNRIRNQLAHSIEIKSLMQSDLDSLHSYLSDKFPKALIPIDEHQVDYLGQSITYKTNGIPLKVKLVILVLVLRDRMAYEAHLIANKTQQS